jgi:tetratricopeptide (TPR) repeat protein
VLLALSIAAMLAFQWGATGSGGRSSVDSGLARLASGDVSGALAIAEDCLAADEHDVRAWNLKARCLESQGDYVDAAEAYRRALSRNSDNADLRYRLALSVLQSGRLEEAEGLFRNFLKDHPDSERAQTELQWLLFNQLREREVEVLLEQGLARNPSDVRLLYHLLSSQQRRPIAQEAIGLLEHANTLVPGQASVEVALGKCAWQMGDTPRARRLFDAARQRTPPGFETELVFADFLLEQGDLATAESVLQPPSSPAGETWRNDDRWWWLQSRIAILKRDWWSALAAIDEAVERRPGEVRYVNSLAVILQALGKSEQAVAARADAERMAAAERELYTIVSRGDLERLSPAICRMIARHCSVLQRTAQANGWTLLAEK